MLLPAAPLLWCFGAEQALAQRRQTCSATLWCFGAVVVFWPLCTSLVIWCRIETPVMTTWCLSEFMPTGHPLLFSFAQAQVMYL